MDRRHFTTGLAAGAFSTLAGDNFAHAVPYSQNEDNDEEIRALLARLDLGPLDILAGDLPHILGPDLRDLPGFGSGPFLVELPFAPGPDPQLRGTGYVIDLNRDLITNDLDIRPTLTPDNPELQFVSNVRLSGDPAIVITQVQTSVSVADGGTVVIGGLVHELPETGTEREVNLPLIGDLPVIGHVFSAVLPDTRDSELVIFITPTIVRGE